MNPPGENWSVTGSVVNGRQAGGKSQRPPSPSEGITLITTLDYFGLEKSHSWWWDRPTAQVRSKCTWQNPFLSRAICRIQMKCHMAARHTYNFPGLFQRRHQRRSFANKPNCRKNSINLGGLKLLLGMQLGYLVMNGHCWIYFSLCLLSFKELQMLISTPPRVTDWLSLFCL